MTPLREENAFPTEPEEGYGFEKLYAEKLCRYSPEDYGLSTRIVRFHNVYGPLGPMMVAVKRRRRQCAARSHLLQTRAQIEVWGDGKQTRSFMYIDDCVEGIHRIMRSDYGKPLNLGTDELVTVDELAEIVINASEKKIALVHDLSKPQGVRGRNSDNTRLQEMLQWQPRMTLRNGIVPTYRWIAERTVAVDSVEKSIPGAAVAAE